MVERSARRPVRRTRALYHSAKISQATFRKLLWHFVRDDAASRAAQELGLSVNSTAAIFRKLRIYFTDVGLFTDVYGAKAGVALEPSGNEIFEQKLLEFHFERVRQKRGMVSPPLQPDYHFAESHWRFQFHIIMEQRPSPSVYEMMLSHLIEIIRLCGPVGSEPANRKAGLIAVLRQMDQRIAWLERNAPDFKGDDQRRELGSIRAIQPKKL